MLVQGVRVWGGGGGRVGGERMLHGNELIQNFTIRKNEETGHLNFQPTWKLLCGVGP